MFVRVTSLFCAVSAAVSMISASALADTVSTSYTGTASQSQFCGNSWPCSPLVFTLPQFSGPGDLTEVSWSFTDSMQYEWGMDTTYEPQGAAWSETWTAGDRSAQLGLDVSTGFSESYYVYGNGAQVYSFCTAILSDSGTFADVSPLVGNGTVDIGVTPFGAATWDPVARGFVNWIKDDATLTVTYVATPEARWCFFPLAAMVFFGAGISRLRKVGKSSSRNASES